MEYPLDRTGSLGTVPWSSDSVTGMAAQRDDVTVFGPGPDLVASSIGPGASVGLLVPLLLAQLTLLAVTALGARPPNGGRPTLSRGRPGPASRAQP